MPAKHPGSLETGASVRPIASLAGPQHFSEAVFEDKRIPRDGFAARESAGAVIYRRTVSAKRGARWQ